MSLRSCKIIEAMEEEGPMKRSRSVLDSFGKKDAICLWKFEFHLDCGSRKYELFAPTRADRDHWNRIFNIILKMNQVGVSTRDINPLEFEKARMTNQSNVD